MPTAPLLWGNAGLPIAVLLFALSVGVLAAILCGRLVRTKERLWVPPVCWLTISWAIPLLDLLRFAGVPIPMTFLEPLLLAGVTGAAAGELAEIFDAPLLGRRRDSGILGFAAVGLLVILFGGWWYHQGQEAYNNYLLGYNDFGHFALRVANTWAGRGFLLETPGLAAFWDHFNPGLALLAPLWGVWPDPRLFLLIQAFCLAVPSLAVYGIARQLGAHTAAAAVWAAAYLAFPAVGQLNLNYTYGWHPVSLALPLLFLAVWAWLRTWRSLVAIVALLACSFQEDVVAVLTCLALAMALQAWLSRRRRPEPFSEAPRLPADQLPFWAWLIVAAVFGMIFVAIFLLVPFSKYQVTRFAELGHSPGEILLAPVIRPAAFWGTVLRPRCGYFLLCLMVPLGLHSLLRGWSTLLAAALPLGVLLAWGHPPATSIAFQYPTALIPVLFLAAMVGAVLGQTSLASRDTDGNGPRARLLWRAGMTALAAGATASMMIGSLPWSSPTLSDVISQTYAASGNPRDLEDRLLGSQGNTVLNQIVARVGGKDAAVLATGRIAAHLLFVRRLDTVGQACSRWKAFEKEVGPNRSPIELFDWVVLDHNEQLYQSPEELRWVQARAVQAGYRLVQSDHGIDVLARPAKLSSGTLSAADRPLPQ
jgi:uncharacterized membrane protein